MSNNPNDHRRPLARLVSAIALGFISGCGESGPPRAPVAGKVTLDGQPLAAGAITFLPEWAGPAVGGPIEGGAFALGRSEGPGPGSYRVVIHSVQPTGKRVPSPDVPDATIDEVRDLIPGRYNRESSLQVEVKLDGENAYQFDLNSQDDPAPSRRVAGPRSRDRGRKASAYVE